MTERQKIAHVLRRFGLGASRVELDALEQLGVDGAFEKLLNYEKEDEGFSVSPWELCFEEGNDQVYLDPYRTVAWWSLRMLMTQRPFQEKLTLFWHDHFAVSGGKIEFGPSMVDYLWAIRANANGSFGKLLHSVSRTPAMLRWLDGDQNLKGQPNENFAREALELFTLGIGNYTEADVREAARAFTGLGIRYLVFERGGERVQETARECMESGRPMIAFCETPDLHDSGPKTILGKTASFNGSQVLDMLAARPETARLVGRKLWEFFAYPNPEAAVVDRMAATFSSSGGDIKKCLRAIYKSPEFWSEKCVRKIVKSPADFVVPIARQFGLATLLRAMYGKPKSPTTPLMKPLRDASGIIFGLMYKQGMLPLFPPDVNGWEWGEAWITSNNMLERMKVADMLFGTYDNQQPLAGWLANAIAQRGPKDASDIVDMIIETFDAPVPPAKKTLLVQACEKGGGLPALLQPAKAGEMFRSVCRLIFGSPEYQFC
jgi:uncharacterized protein (DUF1800 family)